MLYLVASCIALLLGPVFYRWLASGSGLHKGLDGFIFVSLGGLVLVHILPELLEHGGLLALVFVVLGLWGPSASEKLFHRYSELTHNVTLILGIIGLLLHTVTDGGAMVLAQQDSNYSLLALGVILHRFPVGLAIWWLLKPQAGAKWAWIVLTLMILLTTVGYAAGEQLLQHLSLDNTVYLQAFVTGSILHVVLHQPHGNENAHSGRHELYAGFGSLLGLGLLAVLMLMDSGEHAHEAHAHESLQLFNWLQMLAPALLFAHAVAVGRYALGLRPDNQRPGLQWLQRLAGPEVLLLTLLLLGPLYALLQLSSLLLIGGLLAVLQAKAVDSQPQPSTSALEFGFSYGVDRSAPWILLSLLLANLIGHPSVPLTNDWLQVAVLVLLFIPMQFNPLGSTVLAATLAYSGWNPPALVLSLCAAQLLNISQLRALSILQKTAALSLLLLLTLLVSYWQPQWQLLLPQWPAASTIALSILALLFAVSLLRQGPRRFLKALKPQTLSTPPAVHHHSHAEHHH
ncbi:metal transporter [Shewanella dokdonensis]|uniref:Metal transporter n=1 Tax=Shewanella dokdonensis TaxID=712036 RepID=A0ABX8DL46_9GAMM|nr:metal transporter [Shewanella dokdonensis]MCL1075626.1 metal transporter [Shewanella dokdonensis]QVK24627.1 metal transporter [Shewanella dokdonensis]